MKSILKGLFASAIAITTFAGTANAADKILTFSHWAGPKHAMATKVYPWLDEQLKTCSGGSLSVKLENGLAPPPAQYDTVRDGVADIGWIVHGYTKGQVSDDQNDRASGPARQCGIHVGGIPENHENFFAAPKEAKGVQVLTNFVHGPGVCEHEGKDHSYKQLEGRKSRVAAASQMQVGKALGVAGVNMPAPAVYEAISSGVAEGVFFPLETLYSFKINELTKYLVQKSRRHVHDVLWLIMNSDTYNGLEDAQQSLRRQDQRRRNGRGHR